MTNYLVVVGDIPYGTYKQAKIDLLQAGITTYQTVHVDAQRVIDTKDRLGAYEFTNANDTLIARHNQEELRIPAASICALVIPQAIWDDTFNIFYSFSLAFSHLAIVYTVREGDGKMERVQ